MSTQAKYRGWCFTINNYTQETETHIQSTINVLAQYVVYGREIGETGTRHLQGYVLFHNARHLGGVKRLLPRAHLEPRNGTHEQASDYCKKDNDFYEAGTHPIGREEGSRRGGEASKQRYREAIEYAKTGDMQAICESDPQLFLIHGTRLESLYAPTVAPIDGELLHEWWIGPSGSGKSRLLWELYPDHFQKPLNKWWDGYRHQEIVAIEEWSPQNVCTASSLKIWADRYPFTGEIKGGSKQKLRPKKLIILSNYSPHQCFPASEDLEPILRRFTVICFPNQAQQARERAAEYYIPTSSYYNEKPSATSTETPTFDLPNIDLDSLMDDI